METQIIIIQILAPYSYPMENMSLIQLIHRRNKDSPNNYKERNWTANHSVKIMSSSLGGFVIFGNSHFYTHTHTHFFGAW